MKFEPVSLNKEYIKYKDKHEKHAEVKMISQIGKALSGQFPTDDNHDAGWRSQEENKLMYKTVNWKTGPARARYNLELKTKKKIKPQATSRKRLRAS